MELYLSHLATMMKKLRKETPEKRRIIIQFIFQQLKELEANEGAMEKNANPITHPKDSSSEKK